MATTIKRMRAQHDNNHDTSNNHHNTNNNNNQHQYITGMGDGHVNFRNAPKPNDLTQQQQEHLTTTGRHNVRLGNKRAAPGISDPWESLYDNNNKYRDSSKEHGNAHAPHLSPIQIAANAETSWQISIFTLLTAVIVLSALFLHIITDSADDMRHRRAQSHHHRSSPRTKTRKKKTDEWNEDSHDSSLDLCASQSSNADNTTQSATIPEDSRPPALYYPYQPRLQEYRHRKPSSSSAASGNMPSTIPPTAATPHAATSTSDAGSVSGATVPASSSAISATHTPTVANTFIDSSINAANSGLQHRKVYTNQSGSVTASYKSRTPNRVLRAGSITSIGNTNNNNAINSSANMSTSPIQPQQPLVALTPKRAEAVRNYSISSSNNNNNNNSNNNLPDEFSAAAFSFEPLASPAAVPPSPLALSAAPIQMNARVLSSASSFSSLESAELRRSTNSLYDADTHHDNDMPSIDNENHQQYDLDEELGRGSTHPRRDSARRESISEYDELSESFRSHVLLSPGTDDPQSASTASSGAIRILKPTTGELIWEQTPRAANKREIIPVPENKQLHVEYRRGSDGSMNMSVPAYPGPSGAIPLMPHTPPAREPFVPFMPVLNQSQLQRQQQQQPTQLQIPQPLQSTKRPSVTKNGAVSPSVRKSITSSMPVRTAPPRSVSLEQLNLFETKASGELPHWEARQALVNPTIQEQIYAASSVSGELQNDMGSANDRPQIPHVREDLTISTDSASSLQGAINFGELQLIEVIGGGGFGQVWKAVWRGTPVAVKVLTGSAQARNVPRSILEEFAAEINLLSGMRHPNICLYMGASVAPPNRAIITELAANGSLWDSLRLPLMPPYMPCDGINREGWPLVLYEPDPRFGTPPTPTRLAPPPMPPGGTWPWILVKRVAYGAARGMVYLHSGNPPILHRDLKSANILLDDSYTAKVCDFGLSRLKAQERSMTGNCGTVQWMAPEVLANQRYNEKADVFSYGIILWELLTRECPYDNMTPIQCALTVLNRNQRPEIPKWCPQALHALIRSCMKKEPEERPSFEEVIHSLDLMP